MFSGGLAVRRRSPSELGATRVATLDGESHIHAAAPRLKSPKIAIAAQRAISVGGRVSLRRAAKSSLPVANRRDGSRYKHRWMTRLSAGLADAPEMRAERSIVRDVHPGSVV